MNASDFAPSWRKWLFAFSLLLISAALSRWIETDGGSILIHNIPVEIDEYSYLPGRIYRPIAASSLDRKPAVLIDNALSANRNLASPLAVDLAQRGFVVLLLGNQVISLSEGSSQLKQNDRIQSGKLLLGSQPFVDIDKMGLLAVGIQAPFTLQDFGTWAAASILVSSNPGCKQAGEEFSSGRQSPGKTLIPGAGIYDAAKFLRKNLSQNDGVSIPREVILREMLLAVNFFLVLWLLSDRINHFDKSDFLSSHKGDSTGNCKGIWKIYLKGLLLFLIAYGFLWMMANVYEIDFRFLHLSILPLSGSAWIRMIYWLAPSLAVLLVYNHVSKTFSTKKVQRFVALFAVLLTAGSVLSGFFAEKKSIPPGTDFPDSIQLSLLNLWGYRVLWQGMPLLLAFLFLRKQFERSHRPAITSKNKYLFYSTIFAWILASSGF